MRFDYDSYLPNSAERLAHLRQVIDSRPVAILAAGQSISELEKRIGELADIDICYFGFNRFTQEQHILSKIHKRLSLFMLSSREGMPHTMGDIVAFLRRDPDNMFISSFWRNSFELLGSEFSLDNFISDYDRQLLFFTLTYDRTLPDRNHPLHFISGNSLQIAIQLAVIGKASRIVLFGADGYCSSLASQYFRPADYKPASPSLVTLNFDTSVCFNPILPIALRNLYKAYDLPPIEILNCSPKSKYTPFPVVSYDDAIDFLTGHRAFDRSSDLRLPRVTVISSLDAEEGADTLASVQSQTYPTFEHLVLSCLDKADVGIQRSGCPNARLISHHHPRSSKALKAAVDESKGQFVACCGSGDYYANRDWLNICVDILDNHPDVSLVWGLTQNVSDDNGAPGYVCNHRFLTNPPPQGEEFRRYWQTNPLVFPSAAICVRKEVFEQCFPFADNRDVDEEAWILFTRNFVMSGYEPFFVPLIAAYQKICMDQGGHRPEGVGEIMHLPYYAPPIVEKTVQVQKISAIADSEMEETKPHIIIVSEKWCDWNPQCGLSNSTHNLWGSLTTSGVATYDLVHFDEHQVLGYGNPNATLLNLCKEKGPDLVFISWLASTAPHVNPSAFTLDIVRGFGIPVCAVFWDSANPANMEIAESISEHVDLILLADSTTAYLNRARQVEKYLPIWTPQDMSIFNNPGYQRDIDVSFLGSKNTHPERAAALSALSANNIKVYVGGGQREQPLSVEEYAEIYKRSKIVINFSKHAYGYHQNKGRIFEATLCGALLLESQNPETEKWFTPMIDYVPFEDPSDLVQKVKYFLSNVPERQKIAEIGCRKASTLYTGKTFWQRVISRLGSRL